MTNSRIERRFLPILTGAAALLAAFQGTPAFAQNSDGSGPQRLMPPGLMDRVPSADQSETGGQSQSVAPPVRLTPPSGAARQAPSAATPAAPLPQKSGIEIDGLGNIDSESIGTLNESNGGLGTDLWRGVTRVEAVNLIDGLPQHPPFRSLRHLETRLLLSRALAPVIATEAPASLLAKRAKLLLSMGHVEEARSLLRASPIQDRPAGLDQVDATLMLLAHDNARACGLARNNRDKGGEDFWQRLLIYCDALDGRSQQVGFGLSLLRETGGDDTALTLFADAVLTDKPVELDKIDNPLPIHFAFSRAAKSQLPISVAESDDPLVLHAASGAPNLILGSRIEAAERAVMRGVLDPAELRALYTQVPFEDADVNNALSRAEEVGGSGARALLYQAASKINIPVARGEIITSAIVIGREDDRYLATIEAFRPLMDRLPPSPEMVWFALTGVRAYLTLGDAPGVERWIALLRASAQVSDETKSALIRVRPLVHMLGIGERSASLEDILRDWRAGAAGDPTLQQAGALMNGLFLALGEKLPKDAWDGLDQVPGTTERLPSPSVWFRFRDSVRDYAAAKRPGDWRPRMTSTAVALQPPGREQPVPPEPTSAGLGKPLAMTLQALAGEPGSAALFEGVAALKTLGLEDSARRLAVEALLSAGI